MRDLAQIIYENFFPQCLSACPVYSWKLLPVVMIISVSELSLLEFTAFIMACPASVHQLRRSQPYSNLAWPQIAELLCPPLLLPLVFSPWHTEVRGLSLTCTSRPPFLVLLSHPVLSCLGSLILPWVHDVVYLPVKTMPVLSTPPSTLTSPFFLFPAPFLLFKMEIIPPQSQLNVKVERYWVL